MLTLYIRLLLMSIRSIFSALIRCVIHKYLKLKIYRNVILPVVCMGVKLGR